MAWALAAKTFLKAGETMKEPQPAALKASASSLTLNGRQKSRAALTSIISNTALTTMKLAAGFLTGSVAIISEAVHSGMDLLASLMAYVSVRVADKAPDEEHPFGHGKAEHLAALFEGLLIVIAGALIIRQAVGALFNPEPLPALGWGALVMLIATVVNILVSKYLFRVGQRTSSAALVADAWHLRTDVYTSLGVFAALGGIMLGGHLRPGWNLHLLDPLCAMLVAGLILKAGLTLSWEAICHLMDQSLSQEELKLIHEHIKTRSPNILGYGDIRTRRSGSCRLVYMELKVDGALSVDEAHAIGEELSDCIKEHFPECRIDFHLEPQSSQIRPDMAF